MPGGFVHLDVRSFFSLKEGAFSPEALARRAAELHMPAVALADRDGLYGTARFVDACEREGVRPILGASLTVREAGTLPLPRSGRPSADASVVLLARDAAGYANLCRLVTDAHMTGERGDPSLTPEQICAHAGGLVAVLGPSSPPGALALAGRLDAARRALDPYREAFGARTYIGVEHRLERDSSKEIRALLRLAERADARVVATNPVRYLVPEDAFLADALECMRELVPINRSNVSRRNAEGWLKPATEMRALFGERPDLVTATLEIAESCAFDIGLRTVRFPEFPTPSGRHASSVLAERSWRGLERRGMRATARVKDRLHHELAMIHRLGYSAYFLTVADIVADVRAMGIRCACRGSAAGSLVCYLVGISDVDAVRHDLAFERFLNPMRDELPDIDVDVESARREDVYDMVLSRYGDDRCACVAMVDTYRARAAVREVGKALGLPEPEVDVVAKSFPHIGAHDLRVAIDRLPELVGSNLNAGQLEQLFRVAERLDGFPRHIALHPSGIVLSNDDLATRVPLERSFQGYRVIQADKDDVELLGYLKLDVLGVRMLSSMRHALDEIARTEHVKVDLDAIPLDDEPTFELIRASDTLGCFQIESPGQRELLQKLQPTRWEDLIVDISLFRPGPVKSDMINPYLRRRAGMEAPTYAHPALRPALRETFGVIVYHEQVLRTLAALAGYDLTYADHVRRHLDREDLLPGFRADFLERATGRGVPADVAERTWTAVAEFASFGFCKAHAAAFAVPTYQSSWLKTHYPAHFLAGILTHDPGMYPRRLLLEDAREHGIPILPLDVNRSEPEYVVEDVGRRGRAEVGATPRAARLRLRDGSVLGDVEGLRLRSTTPEHGPCAEAETSSPDRAPDLSAPHRRRAPAVRDPVGVAGRAWDLGRRDPVDPRGAGRAGVRGRGGLLAAGERVQTRRGGDRACGGVRWDRGGVAAGSVVCGDDDRSAAGGGSAGARPVLGGADGSALVARVHRCGAGAGGVGGAGVGCEPAPRELLRTVARRSRRGAFEGPAPVSLGRARDGGRREGGVADAGDPQRPADHLPHAGRRDGTGRRDRVRERAAQGRQDRVPLVRARGGGDRPADRGTRASRWSPRTCGI